jgi:hypothetical protein
MWSGGITRLSALQLRGVRFTTGSVRVGAHEQAADHLGFVASERIRTSNGEVFEVPSLATARTAMRPTVAISDVYSGHHPAHYLTPEIPTTATRRMP